MTDADLIAQMRAALDYHEGQAERYRKMLAIAEDGAGATKAPKAKRSGEQRHPPSGGKNRGGRSHANPEQVKAARQMAANGCKPQEIADKLGVKYKTVWTWIRRAA